MERIFGMDIYYYYQWRIDSFAVSKGGSMTQQSWRFRYRLCRRSLVCCPVLPSSGGWMTQTPPCWPQKISNKKSRTIGTSEISQICSNKSSPPLRSQMRQRARGREQEAAKRPRLLRSHDLCLSESFWPLLCLFLSASDPLRPKSMPHLASEKQRSYDWVISASSQPFALSLLLSILCNLSHLDLFSATSAADPGGGG